MTRSRLPESSPMWLNTEQLLLLLLIMVANAAPLLAGKLLRHHNYPVDGGRNFLDGRPLFGSSKTIRGIAAALIMTPLVSEVLGTGWEIGLVIGLFAMLGDLFSSFIKRRLGMAPGSRAPGLDQVPESLFPLLACRTMIELPALQVMLLVLLFVAGSLLLSKVAFHLKLRKHPW